MAAVRKVADHTAYHLAPKGFWKKFRDAVVVNPEISSGLPIQGIHRYPPPGSRTERYATPATKASDPAQNPYWKRDLRRAYPQLSVVTQSELSGLLIEHHEAAKAVAAPAVEGEGEHKDVAVQERTAVDLAEAIATVAGEQKSYSETRLPPSFPTSFKRWKVERAEDAPHDPHSYFPMLLVK
ncbi:21 kDa subunit of NADH dehydrogenase [Irpex rosettiformis]|uniref:21 kDa subunit of NADH dehydrogenase n=1 Tax=Irpex rosettiformis TaxID=378272 RepID=A0ACB8U1B6_9APHY|nr:21 kDa subunit of NADH dehydrogenase [Irpex rosettiformis]